jgi:hypothetical protein
MCILSRVRCSTRGQDLAAKESGENGAAACCSETGFQFWGRLQIVDCGVVCGRGRIVLCLRNGYHGSRERERPVKGQHMGVEV